MLHAALLTVHLLAVVLWVGGMAFVHFFLRPAVAALPPPQRLALMGEVLGRFFAAVLAASLLVLLSGVGMWHAAAIGGRAPWAWWWMAVGGTTMVVVFLGIRFALYPRLVAAIAASQWPLAGQWLGRIRALVLLNLLIGVAILATVAFARLPG